MKSRRDWAAQMPRAVSQTGALDKMDPESDGFESKLSRARHTALAAPTLVSLVSQDPLAFLAPLAMAEFKRA